MIGLRVLNQLLVAHFDDLTRQTEAGGEDARDGFVLLTSTADDVANVIVSLGIPFGSRMTEHALDAKSRLFFVLRGADVEQTASIRQPNGVIACAVRLQEPEAGHLAPIGDLQARAFVQALDELHAESLPAQSSLRGRGSRKPPPTLESVHGWRRPERGSRRGYHLAAYRERAELLRLSRSCRGVRRGDQRRRGGSVPARMARERVQRPTRHRSRVGLRLGPRQPQRDRRRARTLSILHVASEHLDSREWIVIDRRAPVNDPFSGPCGKSVSWDGLDYLARLWHGFMPWNANFDRYLMRSVKHGG